MLRITYNRFDPIFVVVVCHGNMSTESSNLIDADDDGSNSGVRPNLIRSKDVSLPVIIVSLSHPPFRRLNSSLDKSCMLLPTEMNNKTDIRVSLFNFQYLEFFNSGPTKVTY